MKKEFITAVIFLYAASLFAASSADSSSAAYLQKSIAEYESKIAEIDDRIAAMSKRMDDEKNAHKQYMMTVEKDSAKNEKIIADLKKVRETLLKQSSSLEAVKQKYNSDIAKTERKEDVYLQIIKDETEYLSKILAEFPQVSVEEELLKTDILRAEISGKQLSAQNALIRLGKIYNDLFVKSEQIRVKKDKTPSGFAAESAQYLLLGITYAAFISESGKNAAIWNNKTASWDKALRQKHSLAIKKGIDAVINHYDAGLIFLPFINTMDDK